MDALMERTSDAPLTNAREAPSASTANQAVLSGNIDRDFIEQVPIAFARRFGVLGLERTHSVLPVALADAQNVHALSKISALLGIPTEPVLTEKVLLFNAINDAYGQHDPKVGLVISEMSESVPALLEGLKASSDLLDSGGASPVIRLVNLMLLEAVQKRASDIHVQPLEDRLQVRLRIDGVLYDYVQPPVQLHQEIVSRIKVMGRMNIAEKRLPQDGRTTVQVGDKTIDLRINSLPTCYGERLVLRLLDKSARLYRLAELGMNERDLSVFRGLIQQSHGIVLVTGPTGSGKSTTLYAALQELDCKQLNIVTLEDPIEYQLPGISQSQVSDKKGMTFATGLRTVLRQDPDVIMVGEIRDTETARMAIQSSLTGHLVFSTLHTNDAAGAVNRLMDLGIEPYLVAGSLLGVVAQRLVRQICPNCRVRRSISETETQQLGLPQDCKEVFDAGGCERCDQKGYRDRRGVYEILKVTDELHELIAGHAKSKLIKEAARRTGMTTLREDAIKKLAAGKTTIEEVLAVTNSDP